jgi:hypothetical protein
MLYFNDVDQDSHVGLSQSEAILVQAFRRQPLTASAASSGTACGHRRSAFLPASVNS